MRWSRSRVMARLDAGAALDGVTTWRMVMARTIVSDGGEIVATRATRRSLRSSDIAAREGHDLMNQERTIPVEFDPFSEEYFNDPTETYRRLRDEAPVYFNETY